MDVVLRSGVPLLSLSESTRLFSRVLARVGMLSLSDLHVNMEEAIGCQRLLV